MTFTLDLSQDRGKVRLLIPDRDSVNPLFQDDEIDAFLGIEDDEPKLAAALALEVCASDNTLVLKVIRLLDLSTDGPAVAGALMKRADALRQQVADEVVLDELDSQWDIAEMVTNNFSARERIEDEFLRGHP